VKKISSSHHLRLATQIYTQQNYQDDLISLLQDPKVGISSSVGMGDGEFTRCEIELLKEKENFVKVFQLCYSSLEKLILAKENKAETTLLETLSGADDWFIWNSMLESIKTNPTTE
jgi:hypothetical protein